MNGELRRLSGRTASCKDHNTRGCGICFPEVHDPAGDLIGSNPFIETKEEYQEKVIRKIIEYRDRYDLTFEQIAARLGYSYDWVHTKYVTEKLKLKEEYSKTA